MKPNGAVIWRGPSLLTGDPIFVVVTGLGHYASKNTKTGPMAQVWILREDIAPTEAVNTGGDDAICGDCRHRSGSNIGRSCYVIWWTAPMSVWKAYRDQPVTKLRFEDVVGRPLRISAYGDPAAVPTDLWTSLVLFGGKWTGYTHQWRTCDQALYDCRALAALPPELRGNQHAHGPYCWLLRNVRRVSPIPAKGRLGLWTFPEL